MRLSKEEVATLVNGIESFAKGTNWELRSYGSRTDISIDFNNPQRELPERL